MGAGQSAEGGQQAVTPPKTSYYELLAIDKDASEDEIKKAYRRKALELHPDRHHGDEERIKRTTALFAEVQSAYEILSDPQERAWYDSHEDAILHGHDTTTGGTTAEYEHTVGLTTAEDLTLLITRFNGKVEFTDAPSGFFGFLHSTFTQLAKEEARAAYEQDLDPIDYPSFGHKDDTHDDVVKIFYASWASFSTKKTFSWKDKYSTRGVGDRRTRRIIEQENKRFRSDGKAEFNEAVRALVAFVRKRDPRYTPNTQSEQERQNALRQATAAQAQRMRAANQAKMDKEVLPEWAKAREPEELVESEDTESEAEHFECVACRKTYKSEKQWEAHEKSKKHAKAVYVLKKKLQKDEAFVVDQGEREANETRGELEEDMEKLTTHESE